MRRRRNVAASPRPRSVSLEPSGRPKRWPHGHLEDREQNGARALSRGLGALPGYRERREVRGLDPVVRYTAPTSDAQEVPPEAITDLLLSADGVVVKNDSVAAYIEREIAPLIPLRE